jgi:EmrB/QacA subfamily drug resistance transporter
MSLLGGLAQSGGQLITARGLQGFGGAVLSPATLTILTTTFTEPRARTRALGWWSAMAAAGGATGALLGGILTDLLSWRWILFINVPIGLGAALLTQRLVAEGRNPERARGFDLSGAVAATLGLSVLVLGIVRTDATGWGSASTLALLGAGVVLLLGFLAVEGRLAKNPLMPLRIYASRTLSAANLVVLLLGGASFGMWFFLSLYLQQVQGYSPLRAGLAFLPMTACIVIGSTVASRLVSRIGVKPLLVAGMLAETIGLFWFAGISAGGSYLGEVIVPSLFAAAGIGLSFVPATIAAVAGVAPEESGLASGLVNTARLVGGALGLAILAAIAAAQTSSDSATQSAHAALTSGFQLAFIVGSGFAAVGCLIALFGLPRIRPRSAEGRLSVPAEA